jgi:hypothetical protein
MLSTTLHSLELKPFRGRAAALLFLALAAFLGGCAYGPREQHAAARANFVPASPGDQSVRLAFWPWTNAQTALASAKGRTTDSE